MSMYVTNGTEDLGQFASNKGFSDLIADSSHVPELKAFFVNANADSKEKVDAICEALRSLKAPRAVKSTASGLADMIDGEDTVIITNGTHDGDDDNNKDVDKFGDDAFEPEDVNETPEEPEDEPDNADKRVELRGTVVKLSGDRHLVFGWFSVVSIGDKTIEDTQGDMITSETLESAAYEFVLNARTAGEMHEQDKDGEVKGIGRLVESCVFTVEKQQAMLASLHAQGITDAVLSLGCCAWWGGFYVDNPNTWDKVTGGELRAWSIGGRGKRAAV